MKSEDISAHISIKTTFFEHPVIFVSNYIENQGVKRKVNTMRSYTTTLCTPKQTK